MTEPSENPVAADALRRLTRRIRWKRWLGKLHRFAWIVALGFLLLYGADCVMGLGTLSLRIAALIAALVAVSLFAAAWIASWLVLSDRVGVAHLLEQQYPELAERLVTLVQLPEGRKTGFAQLLEDETLRQLEAVNPEQACSLKRECRAWFLTSSLLAATFIGLAFVPSFAGFSQRFVGAWMTPLMPYEITLEHGNGYALRGSDYPIAASVTLLDERTQLPRGCRLICEDDVGGLIELPMQTNGAGRFSVTLNQLQQPLRCRAVAGEARSEAISIGLVDAPVFGKTPAVLIVPPAYARQNVPLVDLLDDAIPRDFEVLRFSTMRYRLPVKDFAGTARLCVTRLDEASERSYPLKWTPEGSAEAIAAEAGTYQAEVVLELDHGLSATLPIGKFTVRDDRGPRIAQSLRLYGSDAGLRADHSHRIAPDASLKLQGALEDDEGLDAVALEYRINDDPPTKIERWLVADGRKELRIDHWLPLPSSLKEGDRVQFRLCVSDNRRIKKGEIVVAGGEVLPAEDLMPNIVFAPAAPPGSEAWFELRVEQSAQDLLKQLAIAQADEIKDLVGKIQEKMQSESDQAKQLQRTIHAQAVLTPLQVQQAEKLQMLDHEIAEDLLRGQKFSTNPELGRLAEHFFDIAEMEMRKSALALKQVREPGRTLAEAEQDLQAVQDALAAAHKKLDRLLDWNKMLAQDRLDRWQLEKLAKRQADLADRLAKLLADLPPSEADRAKEIEAIRQEQAKLAEQAEKLQDENGLVRESAQAAEQMRLERLAKEAEKAAAEQRVMRESPPDKMPAEMKTRLDKLAADLVELAQKGGPEAKGMAKESADALDKAKKAMEASQAMKAKGAVEEAKKMADAAAKELNIAVKQLAKLAQDQAAKSMAKPDAEKTAEAVKQSGAEMRKAEEKLPKLPKDAQAAMKSAAQKLTDAAQQATKQSAKNLPRPMRDPAAKSENRPAGASSPLAKIAKLEQLDGKAWGELPGELKTQMLQDFRARYGAEYAEVIRQYFERLAQTPARKE